MSSETMSPTPVNIVFCEPAYEVTPHIAEFWNTISNTAYIIAAYLMLMHKRNPPRTTAGKVYAFSVIMIGFGSALFHGLQTYASELSDEIAMVVMLSTTQFMFRDAQHPLYVRYPAMLPTVVTVVSMSTCTYVYMGNHKIFEMTFLAITLLSLYLAITMDLEAPARGLFGDALQKFQRGIKQCFGFLAAAYALWIIERVATKEGYCDASSPHYFPYVHFLHTAWHILSATGLYFAGVLSAIIMTPPDQRPYPKLRPTVPPALEETTPTPMKLGARSISSDSTSPGEVSPFRHRLISEGE